MLRINRILALILGLAIFALAVPAFAAEGYQNNNRDTSNMRSHMNNTMGSMRNRNDQHGNFRNNFDNSRYNNFSNYGHSFNLNDRNRFKNNRFFRGNTVYIGYPYYNYAPYAYYVENLPGANQYATYVFVNRDNPQNVLVVGNNSYYGYNYNNIIVIRVSDSTFWRLKSALDLNRFSSFRFDRNRHNLSFSTPQNFYSTEDVNFESL